MTGFDVRNGEKPSALLIVEDWPISDVIPYARNPRKNARAVAKVAASLRRYGWRQPLVLDKDRVLIVGHTRLLAARELGLTRAPVHVAADMSPEDAKGYRLADNRSGEEADWDDELVGMEFADLKAMHFDMSLTGFDDAEIADILGLAATLDPSSAFAALPTSDKLPFEQMTFTLHTDQANVVRNAIDAAKAAGPFTGRTNDNSNGNALARLAAIALDAMHAVR